MASKSKITGALWVLGGTAAGILLARSLAPLADSVADRISGASMVTPGAGAYAPTITPAVFRAPTYPRRPTTPSAFQPVADRNDPFAGAMI